MKTWKQLLRICFARRRGDRQRETRGSIEREGERGKEVEREEETVRRKYEESWVKPLSWMV